MALKIYEVKYLSNNDVVWIHYLIDSVGTVQVLIDGIEIYRTYVDGITYPLGDRTFNLPRPSWMDLNISHRVCVEIV